MTHVYRTIAASAALLAAVFGVAGCGGSGSGSMPGMSHTSTSPSASAAATFNDADVMFASQMIPHHQQAVEMADSALQKATTAPVKNLATAIKAAQDPEIKLMSGWLTAWGKPVPMPGEHAGHTMTGMMSPQEMDDLSKATGSMYDRMWVTMMIKHHQGAVTMAKTEQSTGKDASSMALAKKIQAAQTTEIATMQRLLGRLPAA
ncbi:uncharacterized protein (DUF305 family) [Kribbella aluminosa]|uniref:Uncharacterized protein (DUF305 family) n=1 Tax=Kribbella aluminosa TaxID=416017 RepID=A0ABS4UGC5_9ACTN|nr:DUF305 domain-containing protein [Kribbella aluminosa]MBP2350673.1 uncharacterized protein (DUF305 family) [Kribbella aluminosa]